MIYLVETCVDDETPNTTEQSRRRSTSNVYTSSGSKRYRRYHTDTLRNSIFIRLRILLIVILLRTLLNYVDQRVQSGGARDLQNHVRLF